MHVKPDDNKEVYHVVISEVQCSVRQGSFPEVGPVSEHVAIGKQQCRGCAWSRRFGMSKTLNAWRREVNSIPI